MMNLINLIYQKLEDVNKLKNHTKEILSLSPKIDDEKISNMIEEREKYINSINGINLEIKKYSISNDNKKEINELNKQITESIKEIIIMDKEIRKLINVELLDVKGRLNQPQNNLNTFNIKAWW